MIKSQDDLNQDDRVGRTMTLLKAIEQLEKTEVELEKVEKQLKIAKDCLTKVANAPFNIDYNVSGYYILGQLSAEANEAIGSIEKLNKNTGA